MINELDVGVPSWQREVNVGNRLDCVRDVIIYVFIMLADLTRSY